MKDKIIDIFISMLLFVTCGDLLYLYFMGSWYDPIELIEYTEVVLMFVFALLGLYRSIVLTKRLFKEAKKI